MTNFDHILLFKTSIATDEDKETIASLLNNREGIEGWTVDLEDEDRVLRVVSHSVRYQTIIELIQHNGYNCCELT